MAEDTPSYVKNISHWGDIAGQGFLNGGYFLINLLAGGHDNAEHMFAASLHTTILTWILKPTFKERRPNGANSVSFPSGHT